MDREGIHALVLAAGGSSRFGSPKLMAHWRGKTLLEHTLGVAQSVLPGRVTVVLGSYADQLSGVAGETRVVINQHWRQGLSSSIKTGLTAITEELNADEAGHLVLMLADQVCVSPADINRLLEVHGGGPGITCAGYQQTVGIPAVFSRRWFPLLAELEGDQGAKGLIHRYRDQVKNRDQVKIVPIPGAAHDIDRPADLAALAGDNPQLFCETQEFCEGPDEGLH